MKTLDGTQTIKNLKYDTHTSHPWVLCFDKTMAPHSSTFAWKIHGQRSLVGCSPWGR